MARASQPHVGEQETFFQRLWTKVMALGKRSLLFGLGGALVIVVLVTALVVASPSTAAKHLVTPTPTPATDPTVFGAASPIARENQKAGTTAWQIDPHAQVQRIVGYAGQVSAQPGQMVPLYISAVAPVDYTLAIYRLGWYGGKGAYLYGQATGLHAAAQGYWTLTTGLFGCATCTSDPTTHLLTLGWHPSYTLTIGSDWPSGVYLLKLTATDGGESYIPLVVRASDGAAHAAALVNLPVNTYQAYNLWGDYSLYGHVDKIPYMDKATKVSFDRPYVTGAGAAELLSWDILSIRWLERNGLDADYTTDVDLHEQPASLLAHRLFVDLGHDEYWTHAQRDGVVAARDHGVSMAFLGANDAYWQARLEPNAAGQADRTLVCYKVFTHPSPKDPTQKLTNDPDYPAQSSLVTTEWVDPLLHLPAEEITGLRYVGYFQNGHDYYPAWRVVAPASDPLLQGTGLGPTSSIAHGLLGYEFDGSTPTKLNGYDAISLELPKDLVILSSSPVTTYEKEMFKVNTAYYRAPSGAFVFDAGTIWWCWGLDSFSAPAATQSNVLHGSPAIQRLTTNVITAMLRVTPAAPVA